ncbi:MAG: DUF4386 domain-containing protein [Methanoregula sp.]|jgi:hypothetical protein|nr:DUF4386 domain-containing protein [Methanoregula sp.]
MNSINKTAGIVGVLYIIGTIAGMLSHVLTGPVLGDPDYLVNVSAHEIQIIAGALFVLIMGFSLAMVPVMMYPILKKYHEALALGYVVFRGALETVMYIILAITLLFLLPLSQEYVKAGTPDASYFQTLGAVLLKGRDLIGPVQTIVFCLGALIFYYVLYQTNLIPRWLSGWGLIAVIPYFAAGLLVLFGFFGPLSTSEIVLEFPLALQEMVMAVWLIVKGFNPSALASGSATGE